MTEKELPRYTWEQKKGALGRQLLQYRGTITALALLGVLSSIANGLVPYITGKFFDALVTPHSLTLPILGAVTAWSIFLSAWAIVQLFSNGISWIMDRKNRAFVAKLQIGLEVSAFSTLLFLPVNFHKTHRSGEITDIISRASGRLSNLANTVVSLAPQFLTILIGVGISFTLNTTLACVLLSGLLLYGIVLLRILPPMTKHHEEANKAWNKAWGDGTAAYGNVYTVKQSGAEKYEEERIREAYFGKALPFWNRIERGWSNLNFSQRIVIAATQGVIFVLSVYLVGNNTLTIGGLIAFNSYAGMIIGPFVSLSQQWETIQNGLIAVANSEIIFGTEKESYAPKQAIELNTMRGAVDFKDVHFAYGPGQPEVLKGMNIGINPGEIVALVGETGAGKSTTIELISGYYFANSGMVEIDGTDIRRLNLNELRSQIAVVPQEVVLFNASIADNIRYGKPGAPDEAVRAVAQKAYADIFIEKYPKQYEQEVGERGVKLSVGQKQRIAIARAMLRDPRILILDEPTSALDAETERFITASLEKLMRGRTTFIIAHRLSTVRKADKILVLKDGKIAEEGRHEELMQIPNGVYRHLYELHIGLHE